MSTRHSHVDRIKINPAHVLSLFLNNFIELAYSIPKLICSGFVYDDITLGLERDQRVIIFILFLLFFFCLPFVLRMHVTGLVTHTGLLKEKCCLLNDLENY